MRKDPARSSKKNVKGKKPAKVCAEKNCPKKKKKKCDNGVCEITSKKVEAQNVPVENVVTTVSLLDKVVGQFKDVFGWGKQK